METPNFIYKADEPPLIPTNLSISQNPLPAKGPGVKLETLEDVRAAQWPEVKAGYIDTAGASPGIFTIGQFQCMAICLAFIPNPGAPWTECHLTHVSFKGHAKVDDVLALLNAQNHTSAYVVIGGKEYMKESMEYIRARLIALPTPPVQVWIYAAPSQEKFGFGIRNDGGFGQITY